jgi:hypothetical protein
VTADFAASGEFVLREARLLDRARFAFRFGDGRPSAVVVALAPYQNEDGGFGNALEPDIRGPSSQTVPVEHALRILDELGQFDERIVGAACDWLASVSAEGGGVPFVLRTVDDGPHAPWWEPTGRASVNPTAGIAGLLHKRGFEHPWLRAATAYCWEALPGAVAELGQDDTISVLVFLEHVPGRDRAEELFAAVGERILKELVALDPHAPGYVKSPLDFAPRPDSLARRLFDEATIERHLDALAARQQDDGGWPITWEPPSKAAVSEWRGYHTVRALQVLDDYGRLEGR